MLVCQRPEGKHHGSLWEFPGGKCESGETDRQALARELLEELGVELGACGLLQEIAANDARNRRLTIAFYGAEVAGEPICIEHQNLAWCSKADLAELSFAPADAQFLTGFLMNTS